MIDMWLDGHGTTYISEVIIKQHDLNITVPELKNIVEQIIKHHLVDKELLKSSVKLAKQKQKQQDLNRIERKSFREHARLENAVSEYNGEIVRLLKDYNLLLHTCEHVPKKNKANMIFR